MRKLLAILVMMFFCSNGFGQKIDTIEVSFNKTVILIFDKPVLSDDIGSPDILVAKEGEKVKLAAAVRPCDESTLFIETEDGYFSFIVRYNDNVKKLSYLYNGSQATYPKVSKPQAKEDPSTAQAGAPTPKKETLTFEEKSVLIKDCQFISTQGSSINDVGVLSAKTSFYLANIYYKKGNLYFKIIAKNNSYIDYDIELIRFSFKNKKGAIKQAAVQETELDPIYVYNDDVKTIKGKDGVVKVFVFKKFTIAEEKRLYIEIWENGGERILSFPVDPSLILNTKLLP